jgi:glucokinase
MPNPSDRAYFEARKKRSFQLATEAGSAALRARHELDAALYSCILTNMGRFGHEASRTR